MVQHYLYILPADFLIIAPVWQTVTPMADLKGGTIVLRTGGKFTCESIGSSLTKTKMIVLQTTGGEKCPEI
jgi:hypothetical protein